MNVIRKMLQIMVRNTSSTYPQWIPVPLLIWLVTDLELDEKTAEYAETIIVQGMHDIANTQEFVRTRLEGSQILHMYEDYYEFRGMENRCEEIYLRSAKGAKIESGIAIEESIRKHLIGSDLPVEEIDEAIVYSKYRHSAFINILTISHANRVYIATLKLFAYKLPEKKPAEEWNHHKCSIIFQSTGQPDKYQTCRWSPV